MSFLSPLHIAFFAAVALIALGPKRFPEFTRTLGHTVREFREVLSGALPTTADQATAGETEGSAEPPAPPA